MPPIPKPLKKGSLDRAGIGKAAWKDSLERQLGRAIWTGFAKPMSSTRMASKEKLWQSQYYADFDVNFVMSTSKPPKDSPAMRKVFHTE